MRSYSLASSRPRSSCANGDKAAARDGAARARPRLRRAAAPVNRRIDAGRGRRSPSKQACPAGVREKLAAPGHAQGAAHFHGLLSPLPAPFIIGSFCGGPGQAPVGSLPNAPGLAKPGKGARGKVAEGDQRSRSSKLDIPKGVASKSWSVCLGRPWAGWREPGANPILPEPDTARTRYCPNPIPIPILVSSDTDTDTDPPDTDTDTDTDTGRSADEVNPVPRIDQYRYRYRYRYRGDQYRYRYRRIPVSVSVSGSGSIGFGRYRVRVVSGSLGVRATQPRSGKMSPYSLWTSG
eukprot:gene9153-biopygen780